MLPQFGKLLLLIGAITVLLGLILLFAGKIPYLGKLPGDIVIRKENCAVYFPLVTSLILSLILTLGLNLFGHIVRK